MNETNQLTTITSGSIALPAVQQPPIPDRFETVRLLWSDKFLWVYEVRDRQKDRPARLWIEQITTSFESHNQRSLDLLGTDHPNLWPVYDHFVSIRARTSYYGILAEVPDPDYRPLRTLVAGSVGVLMAGQIFRQLALGLDYCHSRRIVHGHLQPAFIWVNTEGVVRLEPFAALPRLPDLNPSSVFYKSHRLLGTAYASPEQLVKTSRPNPSLDIYALGVIGYELLAGFNPFLAGSELTTLIRHAHKVAPPLSEINPATGPGLSAALSGALVKNSDGRYPTVLDFLSRFEVGLARDLQTQTAPPVYQTVPQLLAQAQALSAEALNFPAFHDQPAPPPVEIIPALVAAQSVLLQSAAPTPPIAAPSNQTMPVPPARPTAGRPVQVSRTPAQARNFQWVSIVPILLVLNLFFMGYVAWLLLNSANTPVPEPPTATAEPGTAYVYPTIDPAELTVLARPQTVQTHFAGSPTAANLTLPARNTSDAVSSPVASPTVEPTIEPTTQPIEATPERTLSPSVTPAGFTATLPPASVSIQPETTQAASTTAGPDAKNVKLDFSPPDDFTAGASSSTKPQAAADRSFFVDAKGQEAVGAYLAVTNQNPTDEAATRRLGRLLYLWKHPTFQPNTLQTLEKAVGLNKDDALAWSYLAFAYYDQFEYAKGTDAANKAVSLAPDLPEALAAHALSLLYTATPDVAVGEITRVAALTAPDNNFWVYLARYKIVRADGDLSGATTLIDNLIKDFPGVAWFYCAKGEILWMQGSGNYAGAIALFQKALGLDQYIYLAHSNLGWVYYLQGNMAQAKREFDLALQNNPQDASALAGTGYILINQKDLAGAQEVLQKAGQLDSRNGMAYNGLAAVYLAQNENDKALEWANRALQFVPNYADAYFNAGQAYYRLNDFRQAATNFQQAARLNPANAFYQEVLAYSLFQLKDVPGARQAAQASLSLQPNNQPLQDFLKQLGEN